MADTVLKVCWRKSIQKLITLKLFLFFQLQETFFKAFYDCFLIEGIYTTLGEKIVSVDILEIGLNYPVWASL